MCLIVLAFDSESDYPLIVAANRDEFHARPSQDANWWSDNPDIMGGRDLLAGGTWLAVNRTGRFAAVTNYRDAEPKRGRLRSRGHLVTEFLQSDLTPVDYLQAIDAADYAGFNLLVADGMRLAYLSNKDGVAQQLPAGIYGLSNATLDTPWEKVERSKTRLRRLLEEDRVNDTHLLRLLGDRQKGSTDEVKSDRLPFSTAHAITAPFIVTPDYGTRCSTIVRADHAGQWHFLERRFDANGSTSGESHFSFSVAKDLQ
jgi:uncharacterized protein with NRDE domain